MRGFFDRLIDTICSSPTGFQAQGSATCSPAGRTALGRPRWLQCSLGDPVSMGSYARQAGTAEREVLKGIHFCDSPPGPSGSETSSTCAIGPKQARSG